jgi:hypothetical protein
MAIKFSILFLQPTGQISAFKYNIPLKISEVRPTLLTIAINNIFSHGVTAPSGAKGSSLARIHDHTQTHHTRLDSSGPVISPTQRPPPDNTQHSQETKIRTPGGIRIYKPRKQGATDPRLRPPGHQDRCKLLV